MPATEEVMIQKSPGRLGGAACIRGTRIAVWMIIEMKQLGFSEAQILSDYPLTEDDLAAVRDYYVAHREEIDAAIRRNNEA